MCTYTYRYNRPVRRLSRLFRGITSNHVGYYYCLGCLSSFRTDNVLKRHERLGDKHDYCHVKMSTEDNKILKHNYGGKSLKAPFMITADLECILKKIRSCLKKSSMMLKNVIQKKKLNTSLQVTRGA